MRYQFWANNKTPEKEALFIGVFGMFLFMAYSTYLFFIHLFIHPFIHEPFIPDR